MSDLDGDRDGDAAEHWRRVAEAPRGARGPGPAPAGARRRRAGAADRAGVASAAARPAGAPPSAAALAWPCGLAGAPPRRGEPAALDGAPPPPPLDRAGGGRAPGGATGAAVEQALLDAPGDVVVLVPEGTRLAPGAPERLAAAADGAAAAAPGRARAASWSSATPVDGLVLAAGLELVLEDGAPVPVAVGAGRAPGGVAGGPLRAALATGLALDRRAVREVGGVAPLATVDAAAVDVVDRLVAAGHRVELVAPAVAIDERPVAPAARSPVPSTRRRGRGPTWSTAAAPRCDGPRRAPPPGGRPDDRRALGEGRPAVGRLAPGLRRRLELARLGHRATVRTIDRADELAARAADVHVVVRGLRRAGHAGPAPGPVDHQPPSRWPTPSSTRPTWCWWPRLATRRRSGPAPPPPSRCSCRPPTTAGSARWRPIPPTATT
ncbi:MAG: hypothetical protein R2711_17610 [Acidimicrobiales bacterium]